MAATAFEIIKSTTEENKEVPRKRGRPRGEWTPRVRYRPKKWLPEFNQLVMDYIIIPGCTHEELGKKYGYGKQQILNILNSPQAKLIQEGCAKGIIKYNETNVPIKLAEISQKAIQRVHDFIHDDRMYSADPFSFIDKTLSITKSIGTFNNGRPESESRGNHTVNNTQVNVAIGAEAAELLGKSIALASSLRDKNSEVLPSLDPGLKK